MSSLPKTETTGVDRVKFIYVFDAQAKSALINAGFVLLKEDSDSSVYIFQFDGNIAFDKDNISYFLSNTLTF